MQLAGPLAGRSDIDLVLCSRTGRPGPVGVDGARAATWWPTAPGPRPLRLAWEQVRLARLLADRGCRRPPRAALHHARAVAGALGGDRPRPQLLRRPRVARAVQGRAVPAGHPVGGPRAPRWWSAPAGSRPRQLARWCRVDAEVVVAPHGVDPGRFRPEEPAAGADAERLAAIDPRLAVGPAPPGVRGDARAPQGRAHPGPGVLGRSPAAIPRPSWCWPAGGAGVPTTWSRGDRARGSGQRVVRTGYVADEAIPARCARRRPPCYPALYEGFGLPALEALACGAPLVTTAGTAMAEVAGAQRPAGRHPAT